MFLNYNKNIKTFFTLYGLGVASVATVDNAFKTV